MHYNFVTIYHCFFVTFFILFSRWCEQDLCPVARNQRRGHYDSNTSLDAALVFDQSIQG